MAQKDRSRAMNVSSAGLYTFGSLLQQELSMMAGYSENLASPVSPHKTVKLGGGLSLVPRLLPAENKSLGTRLGWVLSRDTFSLSNYQRQ